jgi:acyl-CoA synthetase (AMP-forming)/AMP-acid ligase II
MPAPYGLDGATWEEVRRRATALAGLLGDAVLPGDDVDEDAVVAAARSLREAVHHLV